MRRLTTPPLLAVADVTNGHTKVITDHFQCLIAPLPAGFSARYVPIYGTYRAENPRELESFFGDAGAQCHARFKTNGEVNSAVQARDTCLFCRGVERSKRARHNIK